MSIINKTAVLNPLLPIMDNIVDYIPRATTSKFGMVAIGSGINVDHLGRIYLDTQEYSDRLTAIEAQAASTLATQKSEVAAAIAQVNLAQSQTITALTLEVSNLKTNLTNSITATQTDLINRADQLAQEVTDITEQLTQDKATFTQEIQDALVYLENAESVASALRTPRKINGTDFDGRNDITTDTWGATRTFQIGNKTNSINGASNVAYSLADIGAFPAVGGTIQGSVEVTGNLSVAGTISATLEGTAASADKLQTSRTINGVSFDGSEDITLPLASTSVSGTVQLNNTLTSTSTSYALTAAQGKKLNDSKLGKSENAVSASKLETSRTISLAGGVTGSVSFDGSTDVSIATTVTGLGAANGIATLDSNGQVPSTQLPSYVDDVLEYESVAAFPATGVTGKIYVETTGNTTYRWGGTSYVKITSGEVASVAGKVGVVTLTKADVGLANVDNTADSAKNVASATKLTTARTLGGVSFDGTANINLPGVNITGNQSTTGNAQTATTLQTARTINGTSFNGSANITTASWGTARILTLGSTGKSVNGSANVAWTVDEILPTGTSGQVLKHNGTSWVSSVDSNTEMSASEANTGTATTAHVITAAVLKGAIQTHAPVQTSVTGNAATATKLATARAINGVSFDGTANITIADSTKLPLTGGTISGQLVAPNILINHSGTVASGISWYGSSYNSWQDYMAQAGSTGNGVNGNITAPTGTYVTTWARRSVIEPAAGYGWTFETMTMNGTAPSIVAELSINGTFKTAGDIHGANLTASGNINATQFSSASPYSFLNGGAAQNIMTGGVLVSNSYADITKVPTNGIYSKGTVQADGGFQGKLLAKDSRIFKPFNAESGGISAYFVTQWGLNNDYVGGNYGDFLSLNTYHDASPGMQNGLFFDKAGKRIVHYQSDFGAANWGGGKTLAYAEDVLSINGGTMNAPINFNLSHVDNAFHKLIEGTTSTDGGYIAVGNHGSDKGYLELGTTDDPDAAIYARKRNAANTILEEAVILGSDGNTSFPKSVFIRNAPGGYGKNGLVAGNADNATYDYCNIDITSWFGVGIKASSTGQRTIVFNARTGDISNKGSINTIGRVNGRSLGVNNTEGTGTGLSLHNGADEGIPNYGISFAKTSNFSTHGYVDGDWATYFTMTGAHNRGWIFRSFDYGNVASINAQGNAHFNGSITAVGNITAYSDIRIKDNIDVIDDALNKVNQLKGVTYTRKDITSDKKYAGLIAQDVQKVLPEAVAINEDDIISVDYNGVIGLLVEAIKELNNRIDKLERI